MPAVPGDDPTVLALQGAARALHRRGLTDQRIHNYVSAAIAAPTLELPATFTATHDTAGLPRFPARDLFAAPGTEVTVGFDCELVWPHRIPWSKTKRVGGGTVYLCSPNYATRQVVYFDTHFGELAAAGLYRRGDAIGTVGRVPGEWWEPHVHHARHVGRYDPLAA